MGRVRLLHVSPEAIETPHQCGPIGGRLDLILPQVGRVVTS